MRSRRSSGERRLRPMMYHLLLVSHRLVEPRAEKGEEAFCRKIKETFLAIHVEMATKRLHASAGGVPDYVQRYLERFPGYVC